MVLAGAVAKKSELACCQPTVSASMSFAGEFCDLGTVRQTRLVYHDCEPLHEQLVCAVSTQEHQTIMTCNTRDQNRNSGEDYCF